MGEVLEPDRSSGGLKKCGMTKDKAKRASMESKVPDAASPTNKREVVVRGGGKGKAPQKSVDVNPDVEMSVVEERFRCLETSKRVYQSDGTGIEHVFSGGEDLDAVQAFKLVRPDSEHDKRPGPRSALRPLRCLGGGCFS